MLAGLPFLLIQLGYNWSSFGSPLAFSFDYSNPQVVPLVEGHRFVVPLPLELAHLMLLPTRGLFISSPILLLVFLGGRALYFEEDGKWRRELAVCVGLAVVFLMFASAFTGWQGGAAAGPRFLLPVFPFLFVLTTPVALRFPKLFIGLGALSVIINLAISAVGNELELTSVSFPVKYVFQSLWAGHVSVNSLPFPYPNWIHSYRTADRAFYVWDHSNNFHSFNLGELLFPHQVLSLTPLLGVWAVIGRLAWRWLEPTPTAALAAALPVAVDEVRLRSRPRRLPRLGERH